MLSQGGLPCTPHACGREVPVQDRGQTGAVLPSRKGYGDRLKQQPPAPAPGAVGRNLGRREGRPLSQHLLPLLQEAQPGAGGQAGGRRQGRVLRRRGHLQPGTYHTQGRQVSCLAPRSLSAANQKPPSFPPSTFSLVPEDVREPQQGSGHFPPDTRETPNAKK